MQPQENNQPTPQSTAQPVISDTNSVLTPPPQPQPVAPAPKSNLRKLFTVLLVSAAVILVIIVFAALVFIPRIQEKSRNQAVGTQHYVSPDSELGKGIADLDKSQLAAQAKSNAQQLGLLAERYKTRVGSYPTRLTDFNKYPESKIPSAANKYIATSKPTSGDMVYYYRCSLNGAQITYFDTVQNKQVIYGLGTNKNTTTPCA